jgi:hypothetical protein
VHPAAEEFRMFNAAERKELLADIRRDGCFKVPVRVWQNGQEGEWYLLDVATVSTAGRRSTSDISSSSPTGAELGRHEQEQHGVRGGSSRLVTRRNEEPPGWSSALDQGLRERGVDLSNRRSWKRVTRVPGCEVCSSSDRVAIEKAMRRRSLFRVAGDYSTSTWRLCEHRKRM